MEDFLEIRCMDKKSQARILEEIKKRIAEKMKAGLMTEREIKEIEEMRLEPVSDIQDVQNVYEALTFEKLKK
jgi:hypothetical protein